MHYCFGRNLRTDGFCTNLKIPLEGFGMPVLCKGYFTKFPAMANFTKQDIENLNDYPGLDLFISSDLQLKNLSLTIIQKKSLQGKKYARTRFIFSQR